ncbi:MAG: ABC transporter ATP-binding protein [Actinomycetota bacterium]|nr:ABC transporter ATP-binding protein [Actinomycetota bacterium]
MPPDVAILQVQDLSVRYGVVEAVRGISLSVGEGEVVTLIGANGAGKTTTLKAISGVQPAWSGTITFGGIPIAHKAPHQIVKMGVSQSPEGRGVFPGMSVQENLAMGAYSRRDKSAIASDYERVYGLFEVLDDRKRQPAGTLSGGEQQMLAIGRALMARPKLLLLDEPSMGLAPLLVKQIFEIIAQIKQQGTTILLVEQNAHQSLRLADRGYVIESGEITLEGSGDDLLNNDKVRKSYLGEE